MKRWIPSFQSSIRPGIFLFVCLFVFVSVWSYGLSGRMLEALTQQKSWNTKDQHSSSDTPKISLHLIAESHHWRQAKTLFRDFLFLEEESAQLLKRWGTPMVNEAQVQVRALMSCCFRSYLEPRLWNPSSSSAWISQCWWQLTSVTSLCCVAWKDFGWKSCLCQRSFTKNNSSDCCPTKQTRWTGFFADNSLR